MLQSSSKPSSAIFISYRRNDCPGHAGRLKDKLADHFGADQIFMDVDSIGPGEDFVEVIENALGSCAVLIAMIGCDWLTGAEKESRPFDNENDYVRLEIATALRRKVRVIPVLVEGTTMPGLADLPTDMASLTRRNSVELSDLRWARDVAELISDLEQIVGVRQAKGPQGAGVGAAAPGPVPLPSVIAESLPSSVSSTQARVQEDSVNRRFFMLLLFQTRKKKILVGIVAAAVFSAILAWIWITQSNPGSGNDTPPSASPSVQPSPTLTALENFARGHALLNEKKYEEAEVYFREAVNQRPSNPEYNNELGVALFFQKHYPEAEPYLRKAVALAPRNAQYNSDVGNVLNHQSKHAEAEPFDREAARLEPGNADHHNSLGVDLYYQGKKAEAEVSFRKAIRLKPGNAEFHNDLGNSLFDQRKYRQAKAQYQEALRLDPKNPIFQANVNKVP